LKTHYETLGVSAKAEGAVIEGAYKALIKRHHPDKRGPDAAADDGQAQAINEAYRILRDPQKRARYDRTIGLGPSTGPHLRFDETGNVYAEAASGYASGTDRLFWISLGFVLLAALVIALAGQAGSRAWLSKHRGGLLAGAAASSGPDTATLEAAPDQSPTADQDQFASVPPPASAAPSTDTAAEPQPARAASNQAGRPAIHTPAG
jgi:curved DNA-binding protein CbpA